MVTQQLEPLGLSSTCWPLQRDMECAIACDPDAINWNYLSWQQPMLCMPFCLRYFDACLANGALGNYGTFPNASVWCADHGAETNCLSVPAPPPPSPPPPPPEPSPPPAPPRPPPAPPPPMELDVEVWVWYVVGAVGICVVGAALLRVKMQFEKLAREKEARAAGEAHLASEIASACGDTPRDEGGTPRDGSFDGVLPGGGSSTRRGAGGTSYRAANSGGSTERRSLDTRGLTPRGGMASPRDAAAAVAAAAAAGGTGGGRLTPRGSAATERRPHPLEPAFVLAARARTPRDQRMTQRGMADGAGGEYEMQQTQLLRAQSSQLQQEQAAQMQQLQAAQLAQQFELQRQMQLTGRGHGEIPPELAGLGTAPACPQPVAQGYAPQLPAAYGHAPGAGGAACVAGQYVGGGGAAPLAPPLPPAQPMPPPSQPLPLLPQLGCFGVHAPPTAATRPPNPVRTFRSGPAAAPPLLQPRPSDERDSSSLGSPSPSGRSTPGGSFPGELTWPSPAKTALETPAGGGDGGDGLASPSGITCDWATPAGGLASDGGSSPGAWPDLHTRDLQSVARGAAGARSRLAAEGLDSPPLSPRLTRLDSPRGARAAAATEEDSADDLAWPEPDESPAGAAGAVAGGIDPREVRVRV